MESSCQKFGCDILQVLCKENFDQNVIYSPLSIYIALGMTLYGAKNVTSEEMMETLYWDKDNSESFHQQCSDCMKTGNIDVAEVGTVKMANKIFVEKKLKLLESFTKSMTTVYDGQFEKVEFSVDPEKCRKNINEWVEHQTNGKIKDLILPNIIDELTRLVLVNAIYFKGSWQNAFSLIGDKDFYMLNGQSKHVSMIRKTSQYKYLTNEMMGFSAVQIPFKVIEKNNFSLMIILPKERTGLVTLESSIFQQQWKSILNDELFQYSSVMITMPKFKVECQFQMKKLLGSLGMPTAFSMDADFSGMTGGRDLKIAEVVHKAFIDVDENGVEAAAATAVIMMLRCCAPMAPVNPIDFTCDHPFMFALVKNGSMPFFIGHVTQC